MVGDEIEGQERYISGSTYGQEAGWEDRVIENTACWLGVCWITGTANSRVGRSDGEYDKRTLVRFGS